MLAKQCFSRFFLKHVTAEYFATHCIDIDSVVGNRLPFRQWLCAMPAVSLADGRGSGKFWQLWAPNGGTRAFYRQYLTNLKLYVVKGCILVLLKSHLRANRPNPNIIGLDGSCVRWMKTEDFIHAATVPSSR